MVNGIETMTLVGVLSLVISMITQGSDFDNARSVASALKNVQSNRAKLTQNYLAQPSSSVTHQASSGTNQAAFKNIALLSPDTQLTNLRDVFKQVENSVVQITRKVPTSTPNALNLQTPNATSLGSGFVYDNQGHIITNGHVVGDAKMVDVTFVDGNRYAANVVGADIYGDTAVLQITQNNTQQQHLISSLKPLVIGNSSNLEVGDQVIAIGNPFGLSDTMTTGIVSGIGRSLPGAGFSIPNVIQTDAPIDPGNSGGPLLNMQGQVIGMNTPRTGTFSGIGFAIPANTIAKIVPSLIEKGQFLHPYLGLSGATLTSDLARNLTGGPAATNLKGIIVDTITKNGPADKAGVHGSTVDQYAKKHPGDIIIAVDGYHITRIDDLISFIDLQKSIGDNITLTVYRNGHTIELKTTLIPRPSPPFLNERSATPFPIPGPPRQPPSAPTPHS
ncbi:MAG TPA: trypsin-like peptidase domain-containing protein [Candidatus Nitrosopolaris sp.]|nr:trypsin-like peptidase domain-containing protein [Candidatus Nitrosopolaris sp.]